MTDIDELRDRLADLCGWRHLPDAKFADGRVGLWTNGVADLARHPFPPGDLTAIAASFPPGWEWERIVTWVDRKRAIRWGVWPLDGGPKIVPDDTPTEEAMLRLAVLAWEAERAGKGEG